jgi:protein involved in polysaccharide export with SLBB domain
MYDTKTHIYKNGADFAIAPMNTNVSSNYFRERPQNICEIMDLSVGDYIQIYVYQSPGSGHQLENSSVSNHTFTIFRLIE